MLSDTTGVPVTIIERQHFLILLVRNYEVRGLGYGAGVYCLGVALSICLHIPNFVNNVQLEQEKIGTTHTTRKMVL